MHILHLNSISKFASEGLLRSHIHPHYEIIHLGRIWWKHCSYLSHSITWGFRVLGSPLQFSHSVTMVQAINSHKWSNTQNSFRLLTKAFYSIQLWNIIYPSGIADSSVNLPWNCSFKMVWKKRKKEKHWVFSNKITGRMYSVYNRSTRWPEKSLLKQSTNPCY